MLALIFLLMAPLATTVAQETGPSSSLAPERVVVIGVTLLTDFQRQPDGTYEAIGFEDAVLIIQDGLIKTVVPRQNFRIGPNDIAVSGKGNYAVASPIIFGTADSDPEQWLRGRNLLAAGLSGIGSIALPDALANSSAGRCAVARINAKEFPGATPVSIGKRAPEDPGMPVFTVSSKEVTESNTALFVKMAEYTRSLQEAGHSNEAILHGLTNGAAKRIGRSDLGVIEVGARGMVVVTEGNPLDDPSVLFDPHAVVFGDRVLRRAEIEVLRDSSNKGRKQIEATLGLSPPGDAEGTISRWLVSVAAQVFGGAAIKADGEGFAFASVQGEPRFDSTSGMLRRGEEVGYLDYTGKPVRFSFSAQASSDGLSIELSLNGGEPIKAESPGASTPPMMELAADLALRSAELAGGRTVFNVQELVYGEGPIGLAPRALRFTPVEATACPPCMIDQGDVWRMDVMDPEALDGAPLSTAFVAFQGGMPTRIRIESSFGPSWYDQLRPGKVSLD